MKNEKGAALLVTLLVVVIMSVVVTEFLFHAWIERSLAAGFRDSTKALFALRSGVEAGRRIVAEDLKADQTSGRMVDNLKESWAVPQIPIPFEDTYMFLTITDESSKLDLNRLVNLGNPDQKWVDTLRRLLAGQQLDPNIADYVANWVQTGDDGPAGNSWYMSLAHPYKCKHAPLDSLDELQRIRGITPDVFAKISKFLTIRSIGTVNINTAPREVLMSLDDAISPSVADSIIAARNELPFNNAVDIVNVSGFGQDLFDRISRRIGVNSDSFSVLASVTFNEVSRKAKAILAPRDTLSAKIVYFRVD